MSSLFTVSSCCLRLQCVHFFKPLCTFSFFPPFPFPLKKISILMGRFGFTFLFLFQPQQWYLFIQSIMVNIALLCFSSQNIYLPPGSFFPCCMLPLEQLETNFVFIFECFGFSKHCSIAMCRYYIKSPTLPLPRKNRASMGTKRRTFVLALHFFIVAEEMIEGGIVPQVYFYKELV